MASDGAILPDIPVEFSNYADAIKETMKETIKITLKRALNLRKWQSKVGGSPYLPLEQQYPLNAEGERLLFLAQINFCELPHMEGLPKEGIIEFYIDEKDELLGMGNGGFKVLYFKDVVTNDSVLQDISYVVQGFSGPLQKNSCYSMDFSLENQYISWTDYRFENVVNYGDNYELCDNYADRYPAQGHRIGGYPHFAQYDLRADSEELRDYELLFQLDSDEDIMWGDMGVGAFFIEPDDLTKLNFNNILYNWDSC